MRSFPVDLSPYIGETPYAGVDEINLEAAELITVLHNVDRDNFDGQKIGSSKIAIGACGEFFYEDIAATTILAITDQTAAGELVPVPNASSDPWRAEVETDDGALRGAAKVEVTRHPHGGSSLWLGVVVDGVLVGRSPPGRGTQSAGGLHGSAFTLYAPFYAPVGAGLHVIEFVLALLKPASVTYTVELGNRSYFAREITR